MNQQTDSNADASDNDTIVIGSPSNFWRFSPQNGFDLTRSIQCETFIRFETSTQPITVDPSRSALVIIDMQNFFLHPSVRSHETGLAATHKLLEFAIPAARKAAIQIIWLNWGLTQQDIDQAPPSIKRTFGSDTLIHTQDTTPREKIYKGLGESMGEIGLPDGTRVQAGHLLMRDTWNARLYDPFLESYATSQSSSKPDQWFYKNRISGLWSHESPIITYLQDKQIITLFFAGVNTDQCVSGTLQDAFSKGFDCVLLRDACGTTSPSFAQQCIEYNCSGGQGFVVDAEAFAKGVEGSAPL